MKRNRRRGPLSAEQQQLVRENLGLVGLHLKRRLAGADVRTERGERPDLYQEGCLGLMQAAQDYDPASGIPFAAYALRRIHRAIGYASVRGLSLVRVPACELLRARRERKSAACGSTGGPRADRDQPPRRADRTSRSPSHDQAAHPSLAGKRRSGTSSPVRVSVSCSSFDQSRNLACDPANIGLEERPTIAELLRERYLRAVSDAARGLIFQRARPGADEQVEAVDNSWLPKTRLSCVNIDTKPRVREMRRVDEIPRRSRSDRPRAEGSTMIEALVAERLMISSSAWQTPLRKLAERLGCGYPAVAACERRLIKEIERCLRRDEKLAALLRSAASSPLGRRQPIDKDVERELREASATQFMRLLAEADEYARSEILRKLLEIAGEALHPAICRTVSALPDDLRDQFLAEARASATPRQKRPRRQLTRQCA